MAIEDADGYEIAGKGYDRREDILSLAQQASENVQYDDPSYRFRVKFHGDVQMTVSYHSTEVDYPTRRDMAEHAADQRFKAWEKAFKAEYKALAGKAIKLKEDKDLRAENVQKISMNSRYYYLKTRTYAVE